MTFFKTCISIRWRTNKKLTLVEKKDDLVEVLEKVLVVVAVLLDLVEEDHLGLVRAREGGEQWNVTLEMLQRLLLDQVLFLVPLNRRHHGCPDLVNFSIRY